MGRGKNGRGGPHGKSNGARLPIFFPVPVLTEEQYEQRERNDPNPGQRIRTEDLEIKVDYGLLSPRAQPGSTFDYNQAIIELPDRFTLVLSAFGMGLYGRPVRVPSEHRQLFCELLQYLQLKPFPGFNA